LGFFKIFHKIFQEFLEFVKEKLSVVPIDLFIINLVGNRVLTSNINEKIRITS
jgi:hypothetical protein